MTMVKRDTVIILGSGCSAGLDVPTMITFLDSVFDRLGRDHGSALKKSIIEALEDFIAFIRPFAAYIRADMLNIEELYGLADMACDLYEKDNSDEGSKILKRAKNAKKALNAAIYLITVGAGKEFVLSDTYKQLAAAMPVVINESYTEEIGTAPTLHTTLMAYMALAHYVFERNAAVIQFNWDLAFDRAMYIYHESQSKKITRYFENLYYNCDGESPIIIRPHGGINWAISDAFSDENINIETSCQGTVDFYKITEGHEIKILMNKCLVYDKDFISSDICPGLKSCDFLKSELNPACNTEKSCKATDGACNVAKSFLLAQNMTIEPPTWKKDVTHFPRQWQRMREVLSTARRIIFIGYSLPRSDLYFRHFLAMALAGNNVAPKVYVWNPLIMDKDSDVHASYLDVFAPLAREGRLFGLGEKFGDPALYDLNRVMHLSERLEPLK